MENDNDKFEYEVFYSDTEEGAKLLAMENFLKKAQEDAIERPNIHFRLWFLGLILPLVLISLLVLAAIFVGGVAKTIIIIAMSLGVLLLLKYMVILVVTIYQKVAPERIRKSCRFEPTCSKYMLMAIDKYGFWIGFFKGLKRLSRCHHPNGGVDYP